MGLRGRGRRRNGRIRSSHRGEGDVGGVWEGFDNEMEDENEKDVGVDGTDGGEVGIDSRGINLLIRAG